MQQLDLFNKNNPEKAAGNQDDKVNKPIVSANNENRTENENMPKAVEIQNDTDGVEQIPVRKKLVKPQIIETEIQEDEVPQTPSQPSRRGRKSYKETDIDVALLDVPDEETLAQKQYYSISEVAEWFHVNTSLVRFWEKEFDILKPRKNRKGDRLFRPEDVKNLRIIYYLLRQQKYSIEGARQFLKENKKKVEMQVQLAEALTKFRSFLLELKSNLGA